MIEAPELDILRTIWTKSATRPSVILHSERELRTSMAPTLPLEHFLSNWVGHTLRPSVILHSERSFRTSMAPTFFCRQAGLTQGMLQWRPTGALHFFFQASPGMRPARRQHLRPNPAAPTWLRRGLGPGADTNIENQKNKNLPPKRQDSQVSLESPAAFSRPPPTSSTGLWQTRSERKP